MLRDYLILFTAFAALGLALFGLLWLYDTGKLQGAVELESLRAEHAFLKKQNAALLEENQTLAARVAVFERSAGIDRQAIEDVRNDLVGLEEELQAAREEVEFYRGIVSPGELQSGLRIHKFKLKYDALSGKYAYNLVLTRLKQNKQPVSGVVDLKISGLMLGEPGELRLAGVTRPAVQLLKFRFRYFQSLSGVLTLPEGFEASYITLWVIPAGNNSQEAIEAVYDWPESGF